MKPVEKKPRNALRVSALILIALYLILAPMLIRGLDGDVYRGWLEPRREPYTGVISVWHIVRFRPHGGSVGAWLDDICGSIEKRRFGIYFTVTALTEEDAEARLLRGERADVYSFASGADVPQLAGEPALFLRSGYVLAVNAELAERRGLELPEDALVTREWLLYAVEKMSFTSGRRTVVPLSGSGAAAKACGFSDDIPTVDAYRSGNAAMAMVDIRTYADLMRAHERGALFESCAYPFTGFTDLEQFVCAAADAEAEKLPYIAELIELMLSAERQAGIAKLGLIPAVSVEEPEYPDVIAASVADLVNGVVFDLVTLP